MTTEQWHKLADERAAEIVRLRDVASDLVAELERLATGEGHTTNDYLRALPEMAAMKDALK
jgi:hypothetical protein